jgi:hypothetical protein
VEPIVINFKWIVEDLLAARKWHFRHICRPVFRWAIHVIVALIVAVSLFSLLRVGLSPIPIGFVTVAIYLYLIRPFEVRWAARRQFAKRPDKNTDIQWTVSPERISTLTTLGSSEFQWAALTKIIRTPDGFLFYPNEQIFHFLPVRGFRADADYQRLAELASEHASKFVELT